MFYESYINYSSKQTLHKIYIIVYDEISFVTLYIPYDKIFISPASITISNMILSH